MTVTPELVSALRALADLADIRGAAVVASDLRRAASAIEALDRTDAQRLISRARRDRLDNEPGISPTIHWYLREVASGGADEALRAARAGVPSLIRRLLELPALSSGEALTLARRAGALTLDDLLLALDDGRVAMALGEPAAQRLAQAARALETEAHLHTLGRAMDVLEGVITSIADCGVESILPSGDIRRVEPLIASFVIVASAIDPPATIDAICAKPGVDDVLHRSLRRCVLLRGGAEVDVRVAAPDEVGTVLFATTGSRAHLSAMRQRRPRPGLVRTEEEIYAAAGLPFIAPELRNGSGEIEAAARKALPHLVTRSHMRGDLHMHSTYSDGQDTVETMVAACAALGYEYIAISDHSEGAAASRTLGRSRIAEQRDEIERLRARYPSMTILHGIEVDILLDGRLDFEDSILAGFDIVLASLHESGRQDGKTLTRRCLQAIAHPLVNVITHPANRLVGRRGGYPLDFEAIFAAAVETGTALEIDGAPSHIDLDGEHARAAVAAGVTVTIDSDCHRAKALDRQMRFGVGTARRGWVEARHVLNTRPLDEVLGFIRAKRIKG